MRTYAQKHQPSQKRTSGNLARRGAPARDPRAHPILPFQNTIGNQEGPPLFQAKPEGFEANAASTAPARFAYDFARITVSAKGSVEIQPKSTVNPPGDLYEQEADRVADELMRMPEARLQRQCACGGGCPACRQTDQPYRKEEPLQAKRVPGNNRGGNVGPVNEVLNSSGRPLDTQTRDFMESHLGHDFSQVKVHTDGRAVASAQALNARAYTIGRDIAFGEGQYSPQTLEGRRLLAHELTHVIHQTGETENVPTLQRKDEGEARPARTFPGSVKFRGCDEPPYTLAYVRQSAENAFYTTRDDNCIKSESLKEDILAGYDGLTIVCSPDVVPGSCAETIKSQQRINLYKLSLNSSYCPGELAATIFHESIHIAERWNPFEGDLPYNCGASCYPGSDKLNRGDASKCDYERSWLPFAGISAGRAFPDKGPSTGYVRVYAGLEKRGPIVSIIRPSFGIGLSVIGDTTMGEPEDISSGSSKLLSLIGGLRFDPGKEGGAYFSLTGGPEIALTSERSRLGYEVGTGVGYRWSIYDFSLNAGIEYDPTRKAGEEKMYTLGATLQIAPKVRR